MKVIQFITSIERKSGGTSTYIELLSKYLGRLVELHIVSSCPEDSVAIDNATVHYVSCASIFDLFRLKKEWYALLDSIRPEIVHLNGIWEPQSWIVQKEAQKRGIKIVITPHGMMEPWCVHNKAWKKKLALFLYQRESIKKADYLHATTELEKDNMLLWGQKTPIKVIPLGIGVDEIQVKSTWIRTKRALFLSRVHKKKGIEFLLEAIYQLKSSLQGYSFIIAGEGDSDYLNSLKDKVQQYGISEFVSFVGGVYGERKWVLFRTADFFILPSYCENFGYVIAESLAVGTPVITTQETPWDILNESNAGYCVPLNQQKITAAVAKMLTKNNSELEIMGRNARILIETQCNSAAVAKKMVDLYSSLK